jgi:hypothetical protein
MEAGRPKQTRFQTSFSPREETRIQKPKIQSAFPIQSLCQTKERHFPKNIIIIIIL